MTDSRNENSKGQGARGASERERETKGVRQGGSRDIARREGGGTEEGTEGYRQRDRKDKSGRNVSRPLFAGDTAAISTTSLHYRCWMTLFGNHMMMFIAPANFYCLAMQGRMTAWK
jgi:hypothetical protein